VVRAQTLLESVDVMSRMQIYEAGKFVVKFDDLVLSDKY